jgi:hypothetical protein
LANSDLRLPNGRGNRIAVDGGEDFKNPAISNGNALFSALTMLPLSATAGRRATMPASVREYDTAADAGSEYPLSCDPMTKGEPTCPGDSMP